MVLVFFINPIGASELTRGVSSSNLGTNPSTTPGWMDTLEEEQVWDEDAYYAHIDNLDFDFD